MEQAKKSRRCKRDRLSSLPDCLIHLIMSFMTAQEAVRTCLLSKRWQNLWTTLPFLDFDLWKFEYGGPRRNKSEKFRDFVCMTLLRREPCDLHKFRIRLYFDRMFQPECDMFISSWFIYAIKHNPQLLVFDVNFSLKGPLSLSVFTCASLVDVSLNYINSVHNIEIINLPCLRRLHLSFTDLLQDFLDKLFCGCPVLEFLHLKDCSREYSVNINSQRLKYLKLEDCEFDFEAENIMEVINTPNLLYFHYTNREFFGHKMLLMMPSLTSANIILSNSYDPFSYKDESNILIGLSYVKNLQLNGYGIKVLLETELPNCPDFLNLKDLSVIDICLSCHFKLLSSFLNHCPNLEKLSLQHDCCCCEEEVDGNQEPLKIAPFKGKRLEKVEVKFNRYDQKFPRVIKYLQDITEKSSVQINMTSLY
ncbi:hypothetical protein LUZ61_016167 [Rhynchospora tenuis]|uniref:F-box domain-containing protein n=1 Tax=Rhynchospora tenuis TaxID=198213 RepID=A0AAD6EJU0_9POAL|nr:hypothetical protein LUZ61_016167 [Rhynchospora tenuis]